MQKNYQPPLLLEIKYSEHLTRVMEFIYVLALAASVMNSLPILIKCALLMTICSHFYLQFKRLKNQPYSIKHTDALGWELSDGGDFETIQVLPSTVVSVFAVFLHLKKANKSRHHLVIFSDALAEDDYCRLIVRLKTTLYEKENPEA